ncbi:hypothetical protein AVEN_24772-1 [Araneus ventricosus]|uniref:Uncharacterized protein n=1 Tax=Araneus ventricosus TaxID=182803 RepID=A0A4Y2VCD9_ARAVE|nr:hypothetical protein AVEN_24772-1 [Araneus ventricosus]
MSARILFPISPQHLLWGARYLNQQSPTDVVVLRGRIENHKNENDLRYLPRVSSRNLSRRTYAKYLDKFLKSANYLYFYRFPEPFPIKRVPHSRVRVRIVNWDTFQNELNFDISPRPVVLDRLSGGSNS